MAWDRTRGAVFVAVFLAIGGCAFLACGDSTFQGSSPDAGDGSTADAIDDAIGDGGTSSGDATRFCGSLSSTPYFCADFDDQDIRSAYLGTTDSVFFTPPNPTDGGGIGLDDGGGENGSQALRSFLPALGDGGANEYLSGNFPSSLHASRVTLHVDLRFDAVGDVSGSSHIYLLTFELDGDHKTQYAIVVYSGKVRLDVGKDSVSQSSVAIASPPEPTPDWIPLTLDIDFLGGPVGKVTATLGSSSSSSNAYLDVTQQNASVLFGLQSAGGTDALNVRFDNATLDVEKLDAGLIFTDGG